MELTEEGLKHLRKVENKACFLSFLLIDIEDRMLKDFEYDSLDEANQIFDMILYGAGYCEDKYMHDKSMELSDYCILSNHLKKNLETNFETKESLKEEYNLYRSVLEDIKRDKKIPEEGSQGKVYQRMKHFLGECVEDCYR